ncbi:hypothetical protein R1sor_015259 [Riccia sorocarpa]|uniref:Uncharacterized protein n=1 Tax=Riccia sorocarpa TaxID=122646 RepID=A0ABD3HBR9_9MARC
MAEQSGSTNPTEAIDQVLQTIPASSPIASGQEADTTLPTSCSVDPLAVIIAPTSPATALVNSTLAIHKPKDDGGHDLPCESGAFSNIIHTYTMKFENNKPTPKIPLCKLVQFTWVRQFQTTSLQTEALKKSFETHCYMEYFAAFHVSLFDENGKEMLVTDEDKAGRDMLWRMESQEFDAECSKIPEYQHPVNKKFSTWDGNYRRITWMQVSMSPERTTRKAWHRCVILILPVTVYKQIEVAMHNLNASSHATVQYDWIQEAKRCLQVLSTPLSEYKKMIGTDVYEEFEKSRLKSPAKTAWYHENMRSTAAAYILSFGEVSAAKDVQFVAEEDAKKQGKPISSKQKKDMWDARWALWSSLELLSCDIVRKIGIVRGPKEEDEEEKTTRLDAELDKFRAYFEDIRDTYWTAIWYPVEDRQDVHLNIKRAKRFVFRYYVWHLQSEKALACFLLWRNVANKYSMNNNHDTLCIRLLSLSEWELENYPWWVEQPCEDDNVKCVEDAEQVYWDKLMKNEDPFNVSHDRFESGERDEVIGQAFYVEPSSKVDGLVLDTSRTKKQTEVRQSNKAEEEDDTGRTRSTKKQTTRDKAPEQLKKKRDEPVEAELVAETETPAPEVESNVPEVGTSSPAVEEQATDHDKSVQKKNARQRKRSKKQANLHLVYEGCFREDVYFPMKNICVIVKSSLKETHDLLHGNKTKTIKDLVPIVEELKKMCVALDSRRASGFLMNNKQVPTAADYLYLDLPTGLKIDEDDTIPTWNIISWGR